jgi:hypothetical protein
MGKSEGLASTYYSKVHDTFAEKLNMLCLQAERRSNTHNHTTRKFKKSWDNILGILKSTRKLNAKSLKREKSKKKLKAFENFYKAQKKLKNSSKKI